MKELNIKINCHSSICINDNIFIDPYLVKEKLEAKLIFITHSHYDHLDISSIRNIITDNTIIVCTEDSKNILEQNGIKNKIIVVKPNQRGEVDGVKFSTFPAYNVGHHHFLELGFVGYTLEINGITYTICGDTDFTPELAKIKTDVLLIPIGGTYTMDAVEASKATNTIKPKVVIPTHYNTIVGNKTDEKKFISLVDKDIKVKILVK